MTVNTSLIIRPRELSFKDKMAQLLIVIFTTLLFIIAFSNLSFSFELFNHSLLTQLNGIIHKIIRL